MILTFSPENENENPVHCRYNLLEAKAYQLSFSASSLGKFSREFLKLFHFNQAAKNEDLKRSNQLAKLYFNWKFDKVAKIKSLSSFLAFKVSSSFPANQRPLTHLSLAIGPVWQISLDVEDVSVFYGYTGKCTIDL